MIVYKSEELTSFKKAPVGLFLLDETNQVLFKTEYGKNDGTMEGYIVSSGEYYCGDQDALGYPIIIE